VHDAHQVDADDPAPVLERRVLEAAADADADVVHEQVDAGVSHPAGLRGYGRAGLMPACDPHRSATTLWSARCEDVADPVLRIGRDGGVVTLVLNRPEAMNALSAELRDALAEAFRELAQDESVGVVILTGAGRAFCAGLDLKELGGESGEAQEPSVAISEGDIAGLVRAFDRPVIGAINGFAITGGFELALACDVLIASRDAHFADTHARVGILPGWGLSQKLPRLIGPYRAKELSLTGNYLAAEQAERWGLVNRVVEPDRLLATARELADDMLSCDPDTVRGYLHLIDDGYDAPLADALAIERERSRAWARDLDADTIAERRRSIQQRGRRQSKA
jgi:enoyl-CoA hydratase